MLRPIQVSDKDMAYHHTQYVALCEAMRAKDTAIVLQTDAGFSHFALVPSADGRVLLKAVLYGNLKNHLKLGIICRAFSSPSPPTCRAYALLISHSDRVPIAWYM